MATSLADIATINLSVNGQPLTLDSQGRGEFTPNTPGQYLVTVRKLQMWMDLQDKQPVLLKSVIPGYLPCSCFLNDLEGEKIANVTSIVGTVADLKLR
jgi:hypothetical protein